MIPELHQGPFAMSDAGDQLGSCIEDPGREMASLAGDVEEGPAETRRNGRGSLAFSRFW
jgi:hypothetical protein